MIEIIFYLMSDTRTPELRDKTYIKNTMIAIFDSDILTIYVDNKWYNTVYA
jgi:hypothetical protein